MMMKPLVFILVLLSTARGQEVGTSIDRDIDVARTILFDAALSFRDAVPLGDTRARQLSETLHRISNIPDSLMPRSIRGHPTWQRDQQNLTFALFQFDLLRSQSTNHDTLRDAFRELFYAFHNVCWPHFYKQSVPMDGRTVVLFAASITCECTRRLCDEYIAELARLRTVESKGLDVVIVDPVVNPDQLEKFNVDTIPTALLLDQYSREITRVEGGEQVKARLKALVEPRD